MSAAWHVRRGSFFLTAFLLGLFASAGHAQTAVRQINAGGGAVTPFVADTGFSAGTAFSSTATINLAGVTNPAPQAVYQTVRWATAFNYNLTGLTAGSAYLVRLHFVELSFTASGQRTFNVAINGTGVLTNFDIFATAGQNHALVREFNATADGSGAITVAFSHGTADNPSIAGIELYTGGVTQQPYLGVTGSIANGSTIQAENYDTGGEGIAYHDTTAGNTGGAYRTDGVDLEASTDTGGGYNVGWTVDGEWLEYTTNTTAGTYDIVVRGASGSTATGTKSVRVLLDGTVLGTATVAITGGWQTWQDFTISGVPITAGTNRVLRLELVGGDFNLNYVRFASTTAQPPPTPTGLTAAPGNTQAVLNWSASTGATSYNIYRSTTSNGEGTTAIQTGVATTTFTNTGLTNGTTYFYKVAAVNGSGTSAQSSEVSVTPSSGIPATPTGLTASPGNAQVALSWSASSGASSYNIYRSTTSNGEGTTAIQTGVTTTTFTNTGLTNGTTYFYKVAAVNASGTSAQSTEASATPSGGGNPPPNTAVLQINAGGPAVAPFATDTGFSAGNQFSSSATINVSGVTNAAPAAVYQSCVGIHRSTTRSAV